MSPAPVISSISELPDTLPIFPLHGVLLLPRGRLPLNMFEPRYLAMTDDAMHGDRLIGMIQPREEREGAPLFAAGCAGRVVSYSETEDGRYLVTLAGLCRFKVASELPEHNGYRRVTPDWSSFAKDFESPPRLDIERSALKEKLERYFDLHHLSCNWDAVDGATDDSLITCLSMICPFDAGEKQALLEASCCKDRAAKFLSLLDMANCGDCAKARH